MCLDRFEAHDETIRDLPVRKPFGEEFEHLTLPRADGPLSARPPRWASVSRPQRRTDGGKERDTIGVTRDNGIGVRVRVVPGWGEAHDDGPWARGADAASRVAAERSRETDQRERRLEATGNVGCGVSCRSLSSNGKLVGRKENVPQTLANNGMLVNQETTNSLLRALVQEPSRLQLRHDKGRRNGRSWIRTRDLILIRDAL